MSLSGAEVWWSPGKQSAAKAIHFDLDELSHVVKLVLVLNPATLRPVHVRHRNKVEVAQLEDGRDYLEGGEKVGQVFVPLTNSFRGRFSP